MRWLGLLAALASISAPSAAAPPDLVTKSEATPAQLEALHAYIHRSWTVLRRTHHELFAAAQDEKFPTFRGRWPVYVSSKEDPRAISAGLEREMPAADFSRIEVKRLPRNASSLPGLLYLPHPYVVPGGRFNEMYGWDSYFIVLGLLRDGEVQLAKDMVDNFTYEIDHYGYILNANRSYYLTRSQPPFLTQMLLAVYARTKDRAWLASSVPAIEKYYRYWTSPPHLTPETGLSRYHDLGRGPSVEVLSGEKDAAGKTHYDRVKAYFRTHEVTDYDERQLYDPDRDQLTDRFYVADRSMRESGFDPSNRFGPFNAGVLDYNPVCLNSLLYLMEKETAEILALLDRPKKDIEIWRARAERRARAVNERLWDEKEGLYLDYDFVRKRRRDYPFGTTFFPLWAGLAKPEQVARVVGRLSLLERDGGLRTSAHRSGNQWDAPFGWAPLQYIAVEGLRRYGRDTEANRIAVHFLSLVLKEFIEHNAIFEKYDVEERGSSVTQGLKFGYTSNEIGFGWTNATFLELYADLPEREKVRVRSLH